MCKISNRLEGATITIEITDDQLVNCAMHEGVYGWLESAKWGGSVYRGPGQILLLGEAFKFKVIFQKFAFQLLKMKIYGENFRKMQYIPWIFSFSESDMGK